MSSTVHMSPKPRFGWKTFFDQIDKMRSDIRKLYRIIGGIPPTGMVAHFAGTTAQDGWLVCNGTVYNISDYPELGAYLGSLYGGNGTSTFGVPNFTGSRFINSTTAGGAVGSTGGALGHSHTLSDNGQAQVTGSAATLQIRRVGISPTYTSTFIFTGLTSTAGVAGVNTGVGLEGNTDTNTDTRPPWTALLVCIKI